jgi:hypothetical protein
MIVWTTDITDVMNMEMKGNILLGRRPWGLLSR